LYAVVGVVSTRTTSRPIKIQRHNAEDMENSDDDFADHDDNVRGGRRSHKREVFDVTLACGLLPPSCPTKLNVYCYDKWAEKLQFLREGDTVV
jgi:hypothetical protein